MTTPAIGPPAASLTQGEIAELRSIVAKVATEFLLKATGSAPNRVKFEMIEPRAIDLGGARRVAVPVHIEKALCKLALVDLQSRTGTVVEDPDYRECWNMRVFHLDLNEDGVPDFAFDIILPSNRYSTDVHEAVVYLSKRDEQTYCYAARLSQSVSPPISEDALRTEVRGLVARSGKALLDCANGASRR